MALIDERGRVFGRVNLIDATLAAFIVVLIPIGVLTARLFRERQPRIDAVVPASQPVGATRRIRLKGADFRPYLRLFVSRAGEPFVLQDRTVDHSEARFLVESPGEVEVQLPPLGPGTYDVHVLDETREILSHASAFTLTPPSVMTLRATVRFVALGDVATLLQIGDVDLAAAPAGPAGSEGRATIEQASPAGAPITAVDTLPGKAGRTTSITSPARVVEAVVAIPAARNAQGIWMYRDQPIRPGDIFAFETVRYAIRGVVTAVSIADAPAASPDSQGARP